ncbi:MAG: 3-Deoxy-D-manno-octulosonic-acid transferase family protein [Micavibrio sp.]|nr:3-Deoxy-D-manno-octulosonic-acid transferase family protein [Micavibrio sp.]
MLNLYHSLTKYSAPALKRVLDNRARRGKEDLARLPERMGQSSKLRPKGKLAWFHAASVGEAQSTLILINALLARHPDLHILVTTGTVTSATLMHKRLPQRAIHQYYPLDHPDWVRAFMDHWNPDMIFWMESELWPNMLREIRIRNILCILINARMSRRSYRRWKHIRETASGLLSAFDLCLAQTKEDAESFLKLNAVNVKVRDNLKYAADPLPCDEMQLARLKEATQGRPLWVYASTHAGEENLACDIHAQLRSLVPGLLTIIVPRHPDRRGEVVKACNGASLTSRLRGGDMVMPQATDDIYIADTLGELGLFYRLSPITCIGRSFSLDGGGGHNPIEPAQLGSAVLHGPNVQNLAQIFAEMDDAGAALCVATPDEFSHALQTLFTNPHALEERRAKGMAFARTKAESLPQILNDIQPYLVDAGIAEEKR